MRIFLHSPKDMVAGALAFAAVIAIVTNALFLQAGRHPAPLFGTVVVMPPVVPTSASPLPRPRPVEADASVAARGAESPRNRNRPIPKLPIPKLLIPELPIPELPIR